MLYPSCDWYTCYRYATEVDVDFVRKAVRAIGRCAIKVEQAAERCVSTLLDLIQTKVNYVVQEAIVVIKVRFELALNPVVCQFQGWNHYNDDDNEIITMMIFHHQFPSPLQGLIAILS